jgi:hypothetical protein
MKPKGFIQQLKRGLASVRSWNKKGAVNAPALSNSSNEVWLRFHHGTKKGRCYGRQLVVTSHVFIVNRANPAAKAKKRFPHFYNVPVPVHAFSTVRSLISVDTVAKIVNRLEIPYANILSKGLIESDSVSFRPDRSSFSLIRTKKIFFIFYFSYFL